MEQSAQAAKKPTPILFVKYFTPADSFISKNEGMAEVPIR
jgi:hypothetical protein